MGNDSDELRQSPREAIADLPQKWVGPLAKFLNLLQNAFDVKCVILYGSVAKKTYVEGSDIDILVIAEGLPEDFFLRLRSISELYPKGLPLEVLAYTSSEFRKMLENFHLTALEAVSYGIPLLGEDQFHLYKQQLQILQKKRNLRRVGKAWVWS